MHAPFDLCQSMPVLLSRMSVAGASCHPVSIFVFFGSQYIIALVSACLIFWPLSVHFYFKFRWLGIQKTFLYYYDNMFVVLQRLEESHQRHAEEVARLQAENNRLSQQLLQKTEKCKRLENEISELKQCGRCPSVYKRQSMWPVMREIFVLRRMLCLTWMELIRWSEKKLIKLSLVCSCHFKKWF